MDREQRRLVARARQAQLAQRALEARGVALKVDQLAIEDAGHLVDSVGHEESAIEDRDLGLGRGHVLAVQVDGAAGRGLGGHGSRGSWVDGTFTDGATYGTTVDGGRGL